MWKMSLRQSEDEYDLSPEEKLLLEDFSNDEQKPLKTLLGLYKGRYVSLFFSILFFFIKHSPVWVLPIATSNIVNAATQKAPGAEKTIILNVVIMCLLLAQNVITNYVHVWLYSKTIREMERDLRSTMIKKLQQLSIAYHNQMQSGRLQSKIMRDVEQIETLSSQIFISVLSIVMNVFVAFAIVISRSLSVFIFFIATVPVAVLIMVTFRTKIKSYNRDFRNEMEETSVRVMEMVELVPVTRAHALEKHETRKMENQLNILAQSGLRLDIIQSFFSSISWVTFQVFQVLCLGFTGYLAFKGKVTVGDVVLYQTYFGQIVAQVAGIITLLPTIAKGLESVNSVGDILRCHDVEDYKDKKKVDNINGSLHFKNVDFKYSDSQEYILENLSFDIKEGETVAFVGGSGAGKTTIMNLVIGFMHPTNGEVYVDNYAMSEIDLRTYRSHIAVVPQQSILFTGTIRENITYGSEDISDERLWEVIKAASLDEFISSLPDGVDTQITEHGSNLSGGQRQRISIARAFIRNPKILILDEATSALDSVSEKKIQTAVNNLVKNRTTLIVAHRLSTIKEADRIAVIGQGGIIEMGSYDELMEKKGEFYKLKMMQS
jgi:ATP-binding cassette subfamily B protein